MSTPNNRKKSTLWNFVSLNIGFVISIVNGVLIIPLYLHYIDSTTYGYWLATGNVLTWITVVDPGVSNVLLQRVSFAMGEDDKNQVGLSISSGILISFLLFLIAIFLGYIFSYFIADIAKIDFNHKRDILSAFRIALWGTALSLLADTFRNIILAFQKTKIHGIVMNSVLVVAIFVNIILLIYGYGIYSLAYAGLFRGAALLIFATGYSFYLIRFNRIRLRFNLTYFKSFSQIFAYTFFSRLFETVSSNIDLLIVARYLGPSAVTLLDLSRRPIKVLSGITNSVTQSMLPTLPHLFGSGDKVKIQHTVLRIWNIIIWMSSLVIGGFVLLNKSLIGNWVGDSFWVGDINNTILCLSFFLLSLTYNFSNITLSMGDIKNNSLINVSRSIIYIILLYLLVNWFGLLGVILAFLIPLLIPIYYYPKKIWQTIFVDLKDSSKIIKDTSVPIFILGGTVLLSLIWGQSVPWVQLVFFSISYVICFVAILYFSSNSFREESLNLKTVIINKFKK